MQTLKGELLRLQSALSAGLIGKDEFKLAVRERAGRTISQTGRLLPKRGWIGTDVNGERAIPASQANQRGMSRSTKLWHGKPAPEVQVRDMQIAYDRQMVAAGCRSALVKVVKGSKPMGTLAVALSAALE